MLETLRRVLGDHPITILSGYRTPQHNKAVGGAGLSQHCQGRAADIAVSGVAPSVVHAAALKLHDTGAIRLAGLGLYSRWVHVDQRTAPGLARWTG